MRDTQIRVPLMHGLPKQICGLMLMRSSKGFISGLLQAKYRPRLALGGQRVQALDIELRQETDFLGALRCPPFARRTRLRVHGANRTGKGGLTTTPPTLSPRDEAESRSRANEGLQSALLCRRKV